VGDAERRFRDLFESTLQARLERQARSRIHPIIPGVFFSHASRESRNLFVEGHFYGSITLSQAVAEGLAKFLCESNGVSAKPPEGRAQRLRDKGVISDAALDAFKAIRGTDRNNFHHMNRDVEIDYQKLDARAFECVEGLYAIESEVFAFDTGAGGAISVRHAQYWDIKDGVGAVHLWFE